jgi:hypothetical protein
VLFVRTSTMDDVFKVEHKTLSQTPQKEGNKTKHTQYTSTGMGRTMVENKTLDYLDDETQVAREAEETVNLLSFDNVVQVEPPTLISAITTGGRGDRGCGPLNNAPVAGTTPPVVMEEEEADAQEKNRAVGAGVASGVVGL